jgi:hypothetical protein
MHAQPTGAGFDLPNSMNFTVTRVRLGGYLLAQPPIVRSTRIIHVDHTDAFAACGAVVDELAQCSAQLS